MSVAAQSSAETDRYDRKSLRAVTGKNPDWSELAKDAVAFANARGGTLDIGIENADTEPPVGQTVSDELVTQVQRRIREQTSGVPCTAEKLRAPNGGEFLRVVIAVATPIASTSDGRYYLRVGDGSVPVVGADIQALIADRSGGAWETQLGARVPLAKADPEKRARLLADFTRLRSRQGGGQREVRRRVAGALRAGGGRSDDASRRAADRQGAGPCPARRGSDHSGDQIRRAQQQGEQVVVG